MPGRQGWVQPGSPCFLASLHRGIGSIDSLDTDTFISDVDNPIISGPELAFLISY